MVQRGGGVNGIAHVEALVLAQEGQHERKIAAVEVVQIAQLRDRAGQRKRFLPVGVPSHPYMSELLHKLNAGLADKLTAARALDDRTAGITVVMGASDGVQEDARVIEEAPQLVASSER